MLSIAMCISIRRDLRASPGGPAIPALATVADYIAFRKWLGLERVVLVQANAHQFNNEPVIQSLRAIGNARARGVIAVTPEMDMKRLRSLADLGVCGARIMNLPGGASKLADIEPVEKIARDLGWSLIVQFNGNEIETHYPVVDKIAAPFVIDHIGKFIPPVKANDKRIDAVLRLLDKGHVWLKIAGVYETSLTGPPNFADVAPIARRFIQHAPERIIWGFKFFPMSACRVTTIPTISPCSI